MKSAPGLKFRPWPAEDDARLRSLIVSSASIDLIAAEIKRTTHGIRSPDGLSIRVWVGPKAMRRGARPINQPWRPEEDAQLLALLELKMERLLIARKLKRSVAAITIRLMVLRAKGK